MQKHQRQPNEHWHNEGGCGGYLPQWLGFGKGFSCTRKKLFKYQAIRPRPKSHQVIFIFFIKNPISLGILKII